LDFGLDQTNWSSAHEFIQRVHLEWAVTEITSEVSNNLALASLRLMTNPKSKIQNPKSLDSCILLL